MAIRPTAVPAAAPLTVATRTIEQDALLRQAVLANPGGNWAVDHIDDGPYYLATAVGADQYVPRALAPFLDGTAVCDVLHDDGISGWAKLERARIYLLSDLGWQYALWCADGNDAGRIYFDHELSVGPFETLPTTADLAALLAGLLDTSGPGSDLEDTLLAHHDNVHTLAALLRELAPSTGSVEQLVDVLDAALAS